MPSCDVAKCLSEIGIYCQNEPTSYPLIVNTEGYHESNKIIEQLRADTTKQLVRVSSSCKGDDGVPDVLAAYNDAKSKNNSVLLGVAQSEMLKGQDALNDRIDMLLSSNIGGHMVILLWHCQEYLEELSSRDLRLARRIILVKSKFEPFPQIYTFNDANSVLGVKKLVGVKNLLAYLECPTNDIGQLDKIYVQTKLPYIAFKNSLFNIKTAPSVFAQLAMQYAELGNNFTEADGTSKQWQWLATNLNKQKSLEALIKASFYTIEYLENKLSDISHSGNENSQWLFWLSAKLYPGNDPYFAMVIAKSKNYAAIEYELYMALLSMAKDDARFLMMYQARKNILRKMSVNNKYLTEYCNLTGQKARDAAWYLTDLTEKERHTLIRCFSAYDYDRAEVNQILSLVDIDLAQYITEYALTSGNCGWHDEAGVATISKYFSDYKWQKLMNRINPDFVQTVESMANTRPYNNFPTRMSVLRKCDVAAAKAYFVDALGIEYLAYIQAKCQGYDMLAEIHIAHADLPSITSLNKDFQDFFKSPCVNIKELDELKHNSTLFDYEKTKEPIHLINELQAIDKVLQKIQTDLLQHEAVEAVIVSDHGASRLAVISGRESSLTIPMKEKGEHSGRCCKVADNPQIPTATYENGYAILANYDRFKGSRRAEVEVHGGATSEEVLVPIIRLRLKPENVIYTFVKKELFVKATETATLELFCNVPMTNPMLKINGKSYSGTLITANNQQAKFVLPDIRRKGKYRAEIFDNEIATGQVLEFEIKKQTKEVDFGFDF